MELELKDYVKILRKRLWILITLVILATSATGVVSYYFMDPVYEASTKLIVNNSNDIAQRLDLNSVNLDLRLIDTYKQIIKTTAITGKVAEKHPEFGISGEEMIKRINVSSVNNTQVLTLAVKDANYNKAVEIVNAVANVFMEEIPKIMTVNNVSILEPARHLDNPSPVQPNPKLNIAISFVVALMVGVGIAFLLEYLDDTIKTEQDIRQYLEVPVLALIPRVKRSDLDKVAATKNKQAGEPKHVTVEQ